MSSGAQLFRKAEMAYHTGDAKSAFELYQKSIKKILKDEDVTARIPAIIPPDYPSETLVMVWRNFVGFFRDTNLDFTEQNSPEAYKLLNSFRPSQGEKYPQFAKRGKSGMMIYKAIQITAGFTLGLLAWDKGDRPTTAKRYEEAIALANTHAPFVTYNAQSTGTERYVYADVKETISNLQLIKDNDERNANFLGRDIGRKETVNLPHTRIIGKDQLVTEESVTAATSTCAGCGERKAKLQLCSRCRSASYCSAECQKADWKVHKLKCKSKSVDN